MNEPSDPLEAHLAAMRPREVTPGLQRRVAERLAGLRLVKVRRFWRLALGCGLTAACLAAVILIRSTSDQRDKPARIVIRPQPSAVVEAEDPGPTLQAYRQALSRSPEELDALLDKHAVIGPDQNPALAQICAFTRSTEALDALTGEH